MQSAELTPKQRSFAESLVAARGHALLFVANIEKHKGRSKIESRILIVSDMRVTTLKNGAFGKMSVRRDGHLYDLRSVTCSPDDPQTLHLVFSSFLLSFRSPRAAEVVRVLRLALRRITRHFPATRLPRIDLPPALMAAATGAGSVEGALPPDAASEGAAFRAVYEACCDADGVLRRTHIAALTEAVIDGSATRAMAGRASDGDGGGGGGGGRAMPGAAPALMAGSSYDADAESYRPRTLSRAMSMTLANLGGGSGGGGGGGAAAEAEAAGADGMSAGTVSRGSIAHRMSRAESRTRSASTSGGGGGHGLARGRSASRARSMSVATATAQAARSGTAGDGVGEDGDDEDDDATAAAAAGAPGGGSAALLPPGVLSLNDCLLPLSHPAFGRGDVGALGGALRFARCFHTVVGEELPLGDGGGAALLEALACSPGLRRLYLVRCGLGRKAVAALREGLIDAAAAAGMGNRRRQSSAVSSSSSSSSSARKSVFDARGAVSSIGGGGEGDNDAAAAVGAAEHGPCALLELDLSYNNISSNASAAALGATAHLHSGGGGGDGEEEEAEEEEGENAAAAAAASAALVGAEGLGAALVCLPYGLVTLQLESCGLGARSLPPLLEALRSESLESLRVLNLSYNKLGDAAAAAALASWVATGAAGDGLRELLLVGCGLDAGGSTALCAALRDNSALHRLGLETLDLSENRLGVGACRDLGEVLAGTLSLSSIILVACRLSVAEVEAVCGGAFRNGSAPAGWGVSLDLSENALGGALPGAKGGKGGKGSSETDGKGGARALARLIAYPVADARCGVLPVRLRRLILNDCSLAPADVAELCVALGGASLAPATFRQLSLNGNLGRVRNTGRAGEEEDAALSAALVALVRATGPGTLPLRALHLSSRAGGARGLSSLVLGAHHALRASALPLLGALATSTAAAAAFPTLELLDISGCHAGADVVADGLAAALRANGTLARVLWDDCETSLAGLVRVGEAMRDGVGGTTPGAAALVHMPLPVFDMQSMGAGEAELAAAIRVIFAALARNRAAAANSGGGAGGGGGGGGSGGEAGHPRASMSGKGTLRKVAHGKQAKAPGFLDDGSRKMESLRAIGGGDGTDDDEDEDGTTDAERRLSMRAAGVARRISLDAAAAGRAAAHVASKTTTSGPASSESDDEAWAPPSVVASVQRAKSGGHGHRRKASRPARPTMPAPPPPAPFPLPSAGVPQRRPSMSDAVTRAAKASARRRSSTKAVES